MVGTGSRILVWVACLLLVFPAIDAGPKVTQPEVDTLLGRLRGRQVHVKGTQRLVNVFLGVPFAQPPLGHGRFSAPRPAQAWEGVQNASTDPPMCPQDLERMDNGRFTVDGKHRVFPISEDCLVLNIYCPSEPAVGAGRPVMVWVHGGGLIVGAATSQDGSALAAYGDVVVVTVQYRLGIFGFLSTGDQHAPGNWAFLDLVAALHWVQENITPFGGNINAVTLFGGSAGAALVTGLALSPMTAGLFHRVIAQSGVITFSEILDTEPWNSAKSFADSIACSSESSVEMLQCLRQKTYQELLFTNTKLIPICVDGAFFPKSPQELLREHQLQSVPFLLGFNNHEFGWLIPRGWKIQDKMEQMNREDMMAFMKTFLRSLELSPEMMVIVMDEYLGNSSYGQDRQEAFQELLGDVVFSFPIYDFSKKLQDSGVSVFFYEFQHRPSSFSKIKPAWVRADHAAETAFMFGGPFLMDESSMLAFPDATEEEKQLSLTMMAQWANFAWTGDPSGKGLPLWPHFSQSEEYLEISPVPKVSQKPRETRMHFWAETFPTKMQQQHKKMGSKAQEEL